MLSRWREQGFGIGVQVDNLASGYHCELVVCCSFLLVGYSALGKDFAAAVSAAGLAFRHMHSVHPHPRESTR